MKHLLLGDEAIAQGAIDAGLSGVYAYPGTPSSTCAGAPALIPSTRASIACG